MSRDLCANDWDPIQQQRSDDEDEQAEDEQRCGSLFIRAFRQLTGGSSK
jgi:hypothetical protein